MFLLVSRRHVGVHPDRLLGISMQITVKFGENISSNILLKKNCCDLNFGDGLCICRPSFFSQILDLISIEWF